MTDSRTSFNCLRSIAILIPGNIWTTSAMNDTRMNVLPDPAPPKSMMFSASDPIRASALFCVSVYWNVLLSVMRFFTAHFCLPDLTAWGRCFPSPKIAVTSSGRRTMTPLPSGFVSRRTDSP